jgi:hypothetical protein
MKSRKLSLDLDQLSVESFQTLDAAGPRQGTVRAYVCSDFCSVSACNPTCGIQPASGDSECNALPATRFCPEPTQDLAQCCY